MLAAVAVAGALLGVDSGRVMPLDPGTLRPLSRGEPVRGRMLGPVVWSPDRRRVAIALRPKGRVQIVGGPLVRTGVRTAHLAWAGRHVFTVSASGDVAVADPGSGRVVARARLGAGSGPAGDTHFAPRPAGAILAVAPAGGRLALLLTDGIAVVSPTGAVRRVPVAGIVDGDAIAASGATAYVVDRAGVVEVGLASATVRRHAVARAAKNLRPWRSAALLGERTLAISGCDRMAADHRGCERPYGLLLVDTRTWSVRTLDARAANFRLAGRTLVLDSIAYGEGRRLGLRAFSADGILRHEAFRGRDVVTMVAPTHVYAHIIGRPRSRTRAIDLRTGATRLLPARVPSVL
jgi:DNA-binding beta-propeller fold protein YncE